MRHSTEGTRCGTVAIGLGMLEWHPLCCKLRIPARPLLLGMPLGQALCDQAAIRVVPRCVALGLVSVLAVSERVRTRLDQQLPSTVASLAPEIHGASTQQDVARRDCSPAGWCRRGLP